MSVPALRTLRVYDVSDDTQGYRVLVDRLWPRGVRKETLRPDRWAKDIAPSRELRTWFAHEKERFAAFADAYRAELDANPAATGFVQDVAGLLRSQDVLLLYAAKDPACNHAIVLAGWVRERLEGRAH